MPPTSSFSIESLKSVLNSAIPEALKSFGKPPSTLILVNTKTHHALDAWARGIQADEKKHQTYKITEVSWMKSSKPNWTREYLHFNVKNPGRGWLINLHAERCAPLSAYMGKGSDDAVDLVTVHPRPSRKGDQDQDTGVPNDPGDRLATLTFGGNPKQLPSLYDVGLLLNAANVIGGRYESDLWDSPWFTYVIYRAIKERYRDMVKEELLDVEKMSLPPGWNRKYLASVSADKSNIITQGTELKRSGRI